MTAVPAPSLPKDRRHLRVHDAAIGDRIYEIVTTACALVVPALVIALISLAYLEEDGLLLSIALLVASIVLTVELVAVWQMVRGAKWIVGLW